jgi:hypothetical protein
VFGRDHRPATHHLWIDSGHCLLYPVVAKKPRNFGRLTGSDANLTRLLPVPIRLLKQELRTGSPSSIYSQASESWGNAGEARGLTPVNKRIRRTAENV